MKITTTKNVVRLTLQKHINHAYELVQWQETGESAKKQQQKRCKSHFLGQCTLSSLYKQHNTRQMWNSQKWKEIVRD